MCKSTKNDFSVESKSKAISKYQEIYFSQVWFTFPDVECADFLDIPGQSHTKRNCDEIPDNDISANEFFRVRSR